MKRHRNSLYLFRIQLLLQLLCKEYVRKLGKPSWIVSRVRTAQLVVKRLDGIKSYAIRDESMSIG
jgi:hypothetical protein